MPGRDKRSSPKPAVLPDNAMAFEASNSSSLLARAGTIKHAEIAAKLKEGLFIRNVIVVARDDSADTGHFLFILCSWRSRYAVFCTEWPSSPRNFMNLNTLLKLLRRDYGYRGWVSLRLEGEELKERAASGT